jgi:hypothetical protein
MENDQIVIKSDPKLNKNSAIDDHIERMKAIIYLLQTQSEGCNEHEKFHALCLLEDMLPENKDFMKCFQ